MANKVIEKIKEIYKERNNKKKWYQMIFAKYSQRYVNNVWKYSKKIFLRNY